MIILNLGCGTKTCSHPEVVNIDWSMYLRIRRSPLLSRVAPYLLDAVRRERLLTIPENVIPHNLASGIPFEDSSVDAVYHSHFLEHLDREVVPGFLREVRRVLKPGGVQRIVVPDFERLCRAYLDHLEQCDQSPEEAPRHDSTIAAILEQSVRKEGFGSRDHGPIRRRLENLVLGDARKRGETHQWMYDRVNLSALLFECDYQAVHLQNYRTSVIPGWNEYGLDLDEGGGEYKPGSLYIEAIK